MKVQMQMTILGARYYDIADEKTGQVRRFTSIFTAEQMGDEGDRAGMQAGKVSCDNSAVVQQLKGQRFPLDATAECSMVVNAKGQAKITVHSLKLTADKKAA